MGCLSEFGKLGLTSIGNSPEQAESIYNHVVKILNKETGGSGTDDDGMSAITPAIASQGNLH
jgi:hypothetical protein